MSSSETTPLRKVVISSFGDVSNVNVIDSMISHPPDNHVQVRVLYSGFSGTDINMRLGAYPFQKKAPFTPGYCLVGTVERNGKNSSQFKHGTLVACLSMYDAQATLANIPEAWLLQVPNDLDVKQATALTVDWTTAYGLVMHTASVSAGQKVFVHGISGAVGWAVAELCSLQGAEVYGTASQRNHSSISQSMPNATLFDYKNKDWISAIKKIGGVDAVFDALGFESWDESYSILNSSGIMVGYGGNLLSLTGQPARSMIPPVSKLFARNYLKVWDDRRLKFYYITRDDKSFQPDLKALFDLCSAGKIKVLIKRVYEMEEIRDAHRNWNQGEGTGSLVVKVADGP